MEPTLPTLEEVKTFLRLDGNDFDDLLSSLIGAAHEYCADFQNRQYGLQTWELTLDQFPNKVLKFPKNPLQSVVSFQYTDKDGVINTWAPSNYIVDTDSDPGRLVPAYGKDFPSVPLQPINGIRIRFTAGNPEVPDTFKHAMLLFIQNRFDSPESDVNPAIRTLLYPDRVVPL